MYEQCRSTNQSNTDKLDLNNTSPYAINIMANRGLLIFD